MGDRAPEAPPSDIVLSSSSAFAQGVRIPPGAVHVCYCYTPFRYAWFEQERACRECRRASPAARSVLARIRAWDLAASRHVDRYIAISELSRKRIERYYGRKATIIHPPVETQRFTPGTPGDSLLVVSEIVLHKRLQVALEAARRARVPIRVVGAGPDRDHLSAAYPEAEFVGRARDEDLAQLYSGARAVLMPSREEFGIVAVEAQAAGRPVIAAAAGGALETVIDGEPAGSWSSTTSTRSRGRSKRSTSSTSTRPAPWRTRSASRRDLPAPARRGGRRRPAGGPEDGRPLIRRCAW